MLDTHRAGIRCQPSPSGAIRHWQAVAPTAALLIFVVANCFAGSPNTPDVRHQQSALPSSDKVEDRLRWEQLTPAQQTALKPLQTEWSHIGLARKKKWLTMIERFASMTPEEQQRAQERMRDWVKLSPNERRAARENYAFAKKIDTRQRSERWLEYQQLTEDQKRELAARASTKKSVTRIPSAAPGNNAKLQPITSPPPSALADSVTPRSTHQSVLRPQASP